MPMGFSMAMRWTGAFAKAKKNLMASSCSAVLDLNHLAPETAKCVHGGNAKTKSQFPPYIACIASPTIWNAGILSEWSKSHDQASCPRARNASRTIPLNSQATKTLIKLKKRPHRQNRGAKSSGCHHHGASARCSWVCGLKGFPLFTEWSTAAVRFAAWTFTGAKLDIQICTTPASTH